MKPPHPFLRFGTHASADFANSAELGTPSIGGIGGPGVAPATQA
jgi:hypothetical protein